MLSTVTEETTRLGLFISVGEEMLFKGRVATKLHLAGMARERLFAGVDGEVPSERPLEGKGLVAHRAFVRLLFRVREQMLFEVLFVAKRLAALFA